VDENIEELLLNIRRLGVTVEVVDGKLRTRGPRGALDTGMQAKIAANKTKILQSLIRVRVDASPLRGYSAPGPGTLPPLSFTPQRLWSLDQLEQHSGSYNMPYVVQLSGNLDQDALEAAINDTVRRHEIWRTSQGEVDAQSVQMISPPAHISLPFWDVTDLPADGRESRSQALLAELTGNRCTLERGPLMRVGLIRLERNEHIFALCFHHIISDRSSLSIFVRELEEIYTRRVQNRTALMSGSELIEAYRGRIIVPDCATELAAYQRMRAAARSRPRLEQWEPDIDPASPMEASQMQKNCWNSWRGSENPETLSVTLAFQNTPSALVSECITSLVEKHAILSSRFVETGDRLLAHLNEVSTFAVDNLSTFNSVAEAIQCYEDWRKTPIRHDGDWLVRAAVAMVQNDAIAALDLSHLICDGYSMTVLEEDLRQMIARHKLGHTEKAKRDYSFFEYTIAERQWYQSGDPEQLRAYWAKRVDCAPLFSSPNGTPIGGLISGPRTRFQIYLSPVLAQQIIDLAKKTENTPYVLFLSLYALALSDWTNCSKFYISSVYDLRSTTELLATVGYLATTRLTEICFKSTLDMREAINHVWQQEQFSRSIPLPPGAGKDPSIRNGVSAVLNYSPTINRSSQLTFEGCKGLPCAIGEPVITEPLPTAHPISLFLRGSPDGGIGGTLNFCGDHISLDEMRSLANFLKVRLGQISHTI
jgi:hypothetical protein